MKLIIPDSKVKNLITNYLDYNIHPDYNWGPDLFDFYEKDVKEYGFHVFYINCLFMDQYKTSRSNLNN